MIVEKVEFWEYAPDDMWSANLRLEQCPCGRNLFMKIAGDKSQPDLPVEVEGWHGTRKARRVVGKRGCLDVEDCVAAVLSQLLSYKGCPAADNAARLTTWEDLVAQDLGV